MNETTPTKTIALCNASTNKKSAIKPTKRDRVKAELNNFPKHLVNLIMERFEVPAVIALNEDGDHMCLFESSNEQEKEKIMIFISAFLAGNEELSVRIKAVI